MTSPSFMDPELLRRIQALELKAREVADGVLLGIHHAPQRGRSLEFAEHKEYSPGDDIRRIDWKLFAKSDRIYVKEYEDDTNVSALVLIDGSASMAYAGRDGVSKLDRARVLAATLSYLLLTQSDAVGLGVIGEGLSDFLPPRSRQAHFHEIVHRLAALEPRAGTDIPKALGDLIPLVRGRAMVLVFSDFLDDPEPMLRSLRLLRHRRHEPVLFQVLSPEEIEFPFERLSHFQDLESPLRLLVDPRSIRAEYKKHFEEFLAAVRAECSGHGIDYQLARTDDPPARLLSNWLSFRAGTTGARARRRA